MSIFSSDPQVRTEAMRRYRRWQLFKLIYVLCVIFVLPAAIIGFFALYLAIYEPETLRRNLGSRPQGAPVDEFASPSFFTRENALRKLAKETPDRTKREIVAKIKPLLRDTNFQVQDLAIAAMGDWGNASDVPELLGLASDRFATFVRPNVCKALAKIEGDESIDALLVIAAMGSSENESSRAALAKKDAAKVEAMILKRMDAAKPEDALVLCGFLENAGSPASAEALAKLIVSGDARLAESAKKAQAEIDKRTMK